MAEVSMAYSDTALTTLAKASVETDADDYEEFDTVENFPAEKAKEVVEVETLRGKRFKHLKWHRKTYRFIISTNELDLDHGEDDDTKLDFCRDFWEADYKYIYYHDGSTGGNYVEVDTEDDEFPISYMEDIYFMPEIAFNLFSVNKES